MTAGEESNDLSCAAEAETRVLRGISQQLNEWREGGEGEKMACMK